MSNSHLQTKASADWRFLPGQRLHLALQNEKIERWCDSTAYMSPGVVVMAADGNTYAPTGCAAVPESKENTAKLDYFLTPGGSLNFRAGVKWANRKSTFNPYFYNPITDATPTPSSTASGGNGENDALGWMAFFDASRKQTQGHFGVTWTASDAVTLSADGAIGYDAYNGSTLGMQNGHDATVDLQGDFQFSANTSGSAYATWQMNNSSNLEQGSVRNVGSFNWVTGMKDEAVTLGASFKQAGLMANKLSLLADLSYSVDTNSTNTAVVAGSGAGAVSKAASCSSPSTSGYACGSVPDIKTAITRLNLSGTYKVDKKSSVQVGYLYEHAKVNDYLYAGYAFGSTPTSVLPWGMSNPTYTQNAVYAEYFYKFQ
jgi:hypothetical protein